jgi:hypothetical protein
MNNDPNSDSSIPLLTEVVPPNADKASAPPASAAPPKPVMPASAAPTMPPLRPSAPPAPSAPSVSATPPAAAAAPSLRMPTMPPIAKPAPAALPATPPASPLASSAAAIPPAASTAPSAPAELQAGPPLTEEEWARLENAIHQRIARQVLERIDFVLDHRVRHSLTDVVDRAVDGIAAEIKNGLHETLNDIISRAVAQEISRIHTLKK